MARSPAAALSDLAPRLEMIVGAAGERGQRAGNEMGYADAARSAGGIGSANIDFPSAPD